MLQFQLAQSLKVFLQCMANQSRPIHFLPLRRNISGFQKLCIEHNLMVSMRISFHSVFNTREIPITAKWGVVTV
jgi:hypothetical protein